MWALFRSLQTWLAGTRLVGRVNAALALSRVRRQAALLDHQSVARCQNRILLGLVRQAQATAFGRAHDFSRIRTAADFQRLVPLQTPDSLWRDYWQPAWPELGGTTWPGPVSGLPVSAVGGEDGWRCHPLSPALLAAHRAALETVLGVIANGGRQGRHARFSLHPFCYASEADRTPAGSWDQTLAREVAAVFDPASALLARETGQPGLTVLAEQSVRREVRWLAGSPAGLAQFCVQVRQMTGRQRLVDVWPGLAAVLCVQPSTPREQSGTSGALRRALDGCSALVLEAYFPPEGPCAVEDPRYGLLRLLPDHGVYFELVPVEDLEKARPVRHLAAEVLPGVPYALAVTSPAGVWACLTGARVCFERRDPPLFRLLEPTPVEKSLTPSATAAALSAAHPFPVQPPHPRESGPWVALSRSNADQSGRGNEPPVRPGESKYGLG